MPLDTTLSGTYLFRNLPPAHMAAHAARFRRRVYRRGTYLFRAGDPSTDVFILGSGVVKGSTVAPDGDEVVDVMLWGEGEVFGEPGVLIDGAARLLDALVVEETECYVIGRDEFLCMLEQDGALMRRVLAHLSETLRDRVRLISDVAFLSVSGRVARRLLDLSEKVGTKVDGRIRLGVRLSQRDLAGMVLASRESVNRALAALIAEGAVSQQSGTIIIERPALLQRRANLVDDDHL